MDARARMTSKGQVTIPKPVRDALGLREGDELHFRVEETRALVSKSPNLLDLAGAVAVPPEVRGLPWDEVLRRAHTEVARRHR